MANTYGKRIDVLFQTLFHRTLTADPSIFLRATDSDLRKHLLELAESRCLCLGAEDMKKLKWTSVVDPAWRIRLAAYRNCLQNSLAKKEMDELPRHSFVNLTQGAQRQSPSTNGSLFPTLLKMSVVADVGSASVCDDGRLVHPLEHYAVMGWPIFMGEQEAEQHPSAFRPGFVESLDASEVRRLNGNGMHVASVGTWLQFVLSIAERVEAEAASAAARGD